MGLDRGQRDTLVCVEARNRSVCRSFHIGHIAVYFQPVDVESCEPEWNAFVGNTFRTQGNDTGDPFVL